MSSFQRPNMATFNASAAIAKGKAVTVDATGKIVTAANAVTDKSIGIAQGASVDDGAGNFNAVEVALPGGGAKALAGGSISAGDLLAPTTGGALIATTTATNRCIAVAMEDASSGDLFSVMVIQCLI
jgi:hypothetical protein